MGGRDTPRPVRAAPEADAAPARPTLAERSHFSAIARAMEEEKRVQIERAAQDPTANGIRVGLELARLAVASPEIERQERARADAQVELQRRWLRLGRPRD